MLSLKHFAQLIVIILVLSVMFLYLNVNNRTQVSKDSANAQLVLPSEAGTPGAGSAQGGERDVTGRSAETGLYYVVYNGGDETEQKIYENVCRYLSHMKLPFETLAYVAEGDLSSGVTLIFCHAQASQCMEVETLSSYIERGGKALFAAGMPEGYGDSYLSPLWGVAEKGNRMESTVWKLYEGFLPAGEQTVKSPDFEASTRVKLSREAQVYLEDEDNGIPVVYRFPYGDGESVMINSTLMQGRYSGGVFAAALGALKEELVWPVIGTLTVFLDDFPFLLSGYDKNCLRYYGRSTESFERDVLWPVLLSYASGQGLRYTMNLYEQPETVGEDQLNERLLSFLIKENIRYDGEIMLSGHGEREDGFEVRELFEKHFPGYAIQAYGTLTQKKDSQEGDSPLWSAPILRGSYAGVKETQEAYGLEPQDFGYDKKTVAFPVVSGGFAMEEAAYEYLAGLGLYGAVSHSFPMTQLVTASSEEESYEGIKKALSGTLTQLGKTAGFLSPATVTEAAGQAAFYDRLVPRISYLEGEIRISCENFKKGQKFFLRTQSPASGITGGRITGISENYYCVEAQEARITITLEREGTRS